MTRLVRWGLAATFVVVLPAAPAPGARATSRALTPREARPDRALYVEAQKTEATLQASPDRQRKKAEWEKVALAYRRVLARYPQSGYCDDALLAIGNLYRQMAKRFKQSRYNDDAVQAYRMLVAEYPSSSKGDDALFAAFQIAVDAADSRKIAEAAKAYLATFPRAPRAPEVKAALRKRAPAQEASLPQPPPPGLAQVFNLRFWSGDSSTRVVLDVERHVAIQHDRIHDPDRLWIDLQRTHLHPNLTARTFPVGDGLLEQIRIGQNREDVVRVVLDFKDVKDHSIFYLENPTRLVVDVRGAMRPKIASGTPPIAASPEPYDGPPATTQPTPSVLPTAPPSPRVAGDRATSIPVRRLPLVVAPEPSPTPPAPRAAGPIELESATLSRPAPSLSPTPPPRTSRVESESPEPPQVNRAGSYSLARQLGLGVKRIVIDAGHGGHDPGTIGRGGLQEKDLVLDVAVRLERLMRSELGAEVVLTRDTDVFVPLEERTAIANSKGADLFLSIHANSSRNRSARGIETYFLNFAQDPHAEAVAARENAISAATIKDLQNLVKAITLNSKIDESRDFAQSVQEALVGNLRGADLHVEDRGTRTAPFYVLIGANMPSVLAEIAFVSNPDEERLLKTPDHREKIARSLLEGVRSYLSALNRTQARKLTGSPTRGATPRAARGGVLPAARSQR